MHENSTAEVPLVMRYTKNTQAKQRKERKYSKTLETKKEQVLNIKVLEQELGHVSRPTTVPHVFTRYLIERNKVSAGLEEFYSNTSTDGMQHAVPLHRRLKLSAAINRNKENDRLAISIRLQFGQNCTLMMGNWSASTASEPMRGIGMR
jgi:hypothetical protein